MPMTSPTPTTPDPVFELDGRCNERSVFALKVNERVSLDQANHLRAAWELVWSATGHPPKLLILERGMELISLTDDQLRQAGLMRAA
jgi:hypothetical protein